MTEISLENVIESAIQSRLLDLDICLPVTIKKYDSTELLADVQPDFDTEFLNSDPIEAPIVQRVPVCFPMTSSKAITFPLEPGDKAVLICAQRNLDNWKSSSDRSVKDSNIFQLSNGFLIPGVSHKTMVAKHASAPSKSLNMLSDKLFLGDPNAPVSPLLASKGLKQRDLVGILKVIVDTLNNGLFGVGTSPAPFKTTDPTNSTILLALGKELEELSTQ